MSERQLCLLAKTLNDKGQDEPDLPEPREYHREWAYKNRIKPWVEAELWKLKNAVADQQPDGRIQP